MKIDFEINKSPLEKWPGTLLIHMAHGSLPGKRMKLAFLGDVKGKNPKTFWGTWTT